MSAQAQAVAAIGDALPDCRFCGAPLAETFVDIERFTGAVLSKSTSTSKRNLPNGNASTISTDPMELIAENSLRVSTGQTILTTNVRLDP